MNKTRMKQICWRSVLPALLAILAISLSACDRPQNVDTSPMSDVNAPRPTNEVAEKIPWITNTPPQP